MKTTAKIAAVAAVVFGVLLGVALSFTPPAEAIRNSSGNYTLASGNPVTSGTTINASWANNTLNDIGSEITDSLSRSDKGPMLSVLRHVDGTVAAPGVTFANDVDCGLYRGGANDIRMGVNTTQTMRWDTNGVTATELLSTAKGVTATQSTTNGTGVTATGNGTGSGLAGMGGATGSGVTGTGGATGGPGGTFTGTGGGNGVTATGQAAGYGVQGTGGTTNAAGVRGVGGATNGQGVSGQGTGTGTGGVFTGGASAGAIGVQGTGGSTSGAGGVFAGTGGANGVTSTGQGAGVGVSGTGGATGNGGTFTGGATSGDGAVCTGTGGGRGIDAAGQGAGVGLRATGGATNAVGVSGIGGGTGAGGSFSNGTAATATTRQKAIVVANGDIDLSGVPYPNTNVAHTNQIGPRNTVKAWAEVTISSGSASVTDGFNITSASTSGGNLTVTFASNFANTSFGCVASTVTTGGGADQFARIHSKSTSTVVVAEWDISSAGIVDLSGVGVSAVIDVICTGVQ